MRYIGNKELIVPEIIALMEKKGLLDQDLTFFDAFCGTGSVSDGLKDSFDIVVNDILTSGVTYTHGKLIASRCSFEELGFDPFKHLNTDERRREGFFFHTYSPGGSERMYFTPENAARIDHFRSVIEQWYTEKKVSDDEYSYLLACLIESVSHVSNTAGVYGAFLKTWDPRALKAIKFRRVPSNGTQPRGVAYHNAKIEHIIQDVDCDILYLDPPYTQNQYGTQYHLLETLVLDDNPSVSKVTGSRPVTPTRSDWSIEFKTHIQFDRVIATTKARYILLSYSPDGFMSKKFIKASLKRYGKPETYVFKEIDFKKYRNWKTKTGKEHKEYLFFIERKAPEDVTYVSPLNYPGSKAKLIDKIRGHLPVCVPQRFVDAFGGGCNVGININTRTIHYNDNNHFVKDLMESFKKHDTYQYLLYIRRMVKKFGLEEENKEGYIEARNHYNSLPPSKRDPRLLYTIIMYGFNQQIRFNSDYEFNIPVGMRRFNEELMEKMISFSRAVKSKEITFTSTSYGEIDPQPRQDTFYYFDPPYLLTKGAYNDGKRGFTGWNSETEDAFLKFIDVLNRSGAQFMISYVLEHDGKTNTKVKSWIEKKGYRLINLGPHHVSKHVRHESLIVNYKLE